MGTNELQVTLSCGCGRSVVARAKDAGGEVPCTCGNQVAVPRLSDLRTLAGTDAYVTNPAEAIRKLQAQGINPAGSRCLVCGATSPEIYSCHAVCESSYLEKSEAEKSGSLLNFLFLPLPYLICLMSKKESAVREQRGHDVTLDFTLPVCSACAATTGNVTRPKVAKQLMAKVPALSELLAYYPQLELTVERPVS